MNFTSRLYTKINERKKICDERELKTKSWPIIEIQWTKSKCMYKKEEWKWYRIEHDMKFFLFDFYMRIKVIMWINFIFETFSWKENLFNYSLCSIVKHKMIHLEFERIFCVIWIFPTTTTTTLFVNKEFWHVRNVISVSNICDNPEWWIKKQQQQ